MLCPPGLLPELEDALERNNLIRETRLNHCAVTREKKKKENDQTEVRGVAEVLSHCVRVLCRHYLLFPLGVQWAKQAVWLSLMRVVYGPLVREWVLGQ